MIEELRKEIDKLDSQLVELLAKRMELSAQIGREKTASGAEIHQKTREMKVLDMAKLHGDSLGLSDSFITDLYALIFAESRRLQSAQ